MSNLSKVLTLGTIVCVLTTYGCVRDNDGYVASADTENADMGSMSNGGATGMAGSMGSGGIAAALGDAGSAGMGMAGEGGSGGNAGAAGTGGTAGVAGAGGAAGTAGVAGTAGTGGAAGMAGEGGMAGSGGAVDPIDTDGDGISDEDDNCPVRPNPGQLDRDDDGVGDRCDNCPREPNANQADENDNGVGDVCDGPVDSDLDGLNDEDDNCPLLPNVGQRDTDDDGVGDPCDNCPLTPNNAQADMDDNGIGDACPERDSDGDGVLDLMDNCVGTSNREQADRDDDGVGDLCDNCLEVPNNNQIDDDFDGTGDACDEFFPRAVVVLDWGRNELDFDLHVLHPIGEFFSGEWDCWSGNRNTNWANPGLVWDAPSESDTLTEQVRMIEPPAGVYTVGVDLFTAQEPVEGPARITLYCGDGDPVVFGPFLLNSESRAERRLFEAFRFNPEDCSVTPIEAVRNLECDGAVECVCLECEQGICASSECEDEARCDWNSGECVVPCDGVECDAGEFCYAETGQCSQGSCQPCEGGDQCPGNSLCVNYGQGFNFCAPRCAAGTCGENYTCTALQAGQGQVNVCIPDERDVDDARDACIENACARVEECEGGLCDPRTGECVECFDDRDCPGRQRCEADGQCR